jgi:hypothetical protein
MFVLAQDIFVVQNSFAVVWAVERPCFAQFYTQTRPACQSEELITLPPAPSPPSKLFLFRAPTGKSCFVTIPCIEIELPNVSRYSVFFPAAQPSFPARYCLRNPMSNRINSQLFTLKRGPISYSQMSDAVNRTRSTMTKHVGDIEQAFGHSDTRIDLVIV